MWSSTSPVGKTATSVVLSSLCFSTYAEVPQNIPENTIVQSDRSGTAWQYRLITQELSSHAKPKADVVSVSEIVKRAKVQLGLPNKDIADIFLVSRQTIQTYLKGSDTSHAVNNQTKKRALHVLEVLESIKDNFEKSPGAMAKNYTIDNSSLLDLLSAQNLEVNKIQTISRELGKKLSSTASSGQTNNNETLFDLTRTV
jgi:ribosome-binding protein aMBF1 (putative translation factor)